MNALSIPTTATLDSAQLIPSTHPAVTKILHRLSRPSLLSLVLDWLDERNQENTAPCLLGEDEEDDDQEIYPLASSLVSLRELYTELQSRRGTRRDVTDRIIEGDWRNGISLYQLAMADMQYLYDHPASQKWTALQVVRLSPLDSDPSDTIDKTLPSIPRFHPSTFLRNLQKESLPDVKAHYNLDRHATLPLLILRVFILESPYNTSLALSSQTKQKLVFDSSRTFYIAFPDFSPYVYISLNTPPLSSESNAAPSRVDNKSLRKLMLEGIPKAFSKPRDRYRLQTTNLSARNLKALVDRRGGGRTNAAGGGWGGYADDKKESGDNPLDLQLPTPDTSVDDFENQDDEPKGSKSLKRKRDEDEGVVRRRKQVANGRFGTTGKSDDGNGIERLDIRIEDPFPNVGPDDELFQADSAAVHTKEKQRGRRSTLDLSLAHEDEDDEIDDLVWRPDVRLTFHGQHVFAGIRELVEAGIVDGEKMPGWMTGEEGVSLGIVRKGRIVGFKGTGI